MSWAAAGAAGASIGGALLGAHSAQQANKTAIALNSKQMAFQERMRDTQYQSAVKDMQAAGLNPMLAYQHGGSGTPSGAGAPDIKPEFDGAQLMNSALSFARLQNENKQIDAAVQNMEADTSIKIAEVKRVLQDTQFKAMQTTTESYKGGLVANQAALARAQEHSLNSLLYDTMQNLRAQASQSHATAAQIRSQNALMKELQTNPSTKNWAPYILDIMRRGK